jgi:hypothetical protein
MKTFVALSPDSMMTIDEAAAEGAANLHVPTMPEPRRRNRRGSHFTTIG